MKQYDNRGTITIDHCGLASGADGPCFNLLKANKIDLQTFKGNYSNKHGYPPGSKVIEMCLLSRTTQTFGWQSPLVVLNLIWKVML